MDFSRYMRWTVLDDLGQLGSAPPGAGPGRRMPFPVNVETASSTTNGATFTTGSFTPKANVLQVIDVLSNETTTAETPTSITGCGLTWTLVTGGERFLGALGTTRKLSRWTGVGSAPTAGSLTITFANAMLSVAWSWNAIPGADTVGSVRQTASAGAASGTTINATLSAFENQNNIHLAVVGLSSQATVTPDADFVELGDDNESASTCTIETEWARGQLACDPTFSAAISGIISSEIRAA